MEWDYHPNPPETTLAATPRTFLLWELYAYSNPCLEQSSLHFFLRLIPTRLSNLSLYVTFLKKPLTPQSGWESLLCTLHDIC